MPSVGENHDRWSSHAWPADGDEWSGGWGDSRSLWFTTLLPRLSGFLPTKRVVDLGCGRGRMARFLASQARELHLVDLVPACVEHCRARFGRRFEGCAMRYRVSDGSSLEGIRSGTVGLLFSWDSLVHADAGTMEAYVHDAARVLEAGGVAFVHHSNTGAYRDEMSGALTIANEHWRAEDVSAAMVAGWCESAGLWCVTQELIPWGGGSEPFRDCFTLVMKPGRGRERPPGVRFENPRFDDETALARRHAELYRPAEHRVARTPGDHRLEGRVDPVRR